MSIEETEAHTINAKIADLEARTGVHVTTAIVARSDAYVELPWKAFALGASLAAFAVVLTAMLAPTWAARSSTALWHAIAILGVGGASALAAVWIPAWARLFLRPARRDVEVRQYAQSMFLNRELFGTPRRSGLLILVSRFERKIQLLPDVGFDDRVSKAEWRTVIAHMTPLLRDGHALRAMHEGIAALDQLLVRKGFGAAPAMAVEGPK